VLRVAPTLAKQPPPDFGPKFSIIPVAPLKIYIHFFVHHKEFFGLLSQAVQCAATLSDNETLQLIEDASDESQDAGDSDSFTISTPLAPDNPPRSTVAVSAPPKRRRARHKTGAY